MGSGTVEVLVVDSATFIRGYQVQNYCKKAATVKEVVSEIRDARTRQSLQVLPYELELRDPRPESILHVSNFAKKTGDFGILSLTDLKVLALTYELECELGSLKGDNLRSTPLQKVEYTDQWVPFSSAMPGVIGGESLHSDTISQSSSNTTSVNERKACSTESQDKMTEGETVFQLNEHDCENASTKSESQPSALGDVRSHDSCQNPQNEHNSDHNTSGTSLEDKLEEVSLRVSTKDGNRETHHSCGGSDDSHVDDGNTTDVGKHDSKDGNHPGDCDGDDDSTNDDDGDDDDDDDDGWITPENVQEARKEMGGLVEEQLEGVVVGCMTTDFAMQNVLLQLGLSVVSPEGLLIKEVRTYLLQCKGCFKTTSDMTKVFCPTCGNRTLIRVIANVGADGKRSHKPLSVKQFSTKGVRYSQPKMKGGRHANNPIVVEDQRNTYCQPRKKGTKIDVFSPDYVARSSPFATHDVTSRGANISFGKGSNRLPKNPNEVRKKGKRKK